ncbi:MAG: hypothetical protein ABW123_17530 [Cystobacter sp.]
MARALDVNVLIPPPLRPLFNGRREVNLGMPANAGVGEVFETLLSLYPRLAQHLAGDAPARGGSYVHLALEAPALAELAAGGTGLSSGRRLHLFLLSRPPATASLRAEG